MKIQRVVLVWLLLAFYNRVEADIDGRALEATPLAYGEAVTGRGVVTDYVLPGVNDNTAGVAQWLDVKIRSVGCAEQAEAAVAYVAFGEAPDAWHRVLPYSWSWDVGRREGHALYGPLSRVENYDPSTGEQSALPLYLSVQTPDSSCRYELFADLYAIRTARLNAWSAPLGFADVAQSLGAQQIVFQIPLDYLSTGELLVAQARYAGDSCGPLPAAQLPQFYLSRSTLYSPATIATLDSVSRTSLAQGRTTLLVSSLQQFDVGGSSSELWFAGILPPPDPACAQFQLVFDLVEHTVLTPRHANASLFIEGSVWSYATRLAHDDPVTLTFDFAFYPSAFVEIFWAAGRFPTDYDYDGRSGPVVDYGQSDQPAYSVNLTVAQQNLHIGFLPTSLAAVANIATTVVATGPAPPAPPDDDSDDDSGSMSVGAIVAIVLSVVAAAAIAAAVALLLYTRHQRSAAATTSVSVAAASTLDFVKAENPAGSSYARLIADNDDQTTDSDHD